MLHCVSVHHDEVACRVAAGTTSARTSRDHPPGLASGTSWDVTAMDRTVYDCYDPPPPTAFLTPPSLLPPSIYHPPAVAGVAELSYCPPTSRLHSDVDSSPPYFERRFLPAEAMVDRATSGVYGGGGMSMQYRDVPTKSAGGCVSGSGLRDDRGDCSMHSSMLLACDSLLRTPANLTPPPPPLSMFTWRPPGQTNCSDHSSSFPPTYFTNFVVDQPSCHSPVGADRESVHSFNPLMAGSQLGV